MPMAHQKALAAKDASHRAQLEELRAEHANIMSREREEHALEIIEAEAKAEAEGNVAILADESIPDAFDNPKYSYLNQFF